MAGKNRPLAGQARPIPGQSVVERIHAQAHLQPGRIALASPAGSQTFGQCWSRARGIAAALADSGVGPGERIAVWAGRTPGSVIAALAVMLAGAAYVPIEPAHPARRCQAVLAAAGARLLLVDGQCPIPPPPELGIGQADIAAMPDDGRPDPPFPLGADLAYVIFTSGSSGVPKGVMVEHQSLLNYADWCATVVGRAGGTPLIASLGFDGSMSSLWPQLTRGQPVFVCGGAWDEAIFRGYPEPFSYAKLTPSIVRFFERTKQPRYRDFAALLMIGGEMLESRLIQQIGSRITGVRLINHYGPTEATIGCCFHEFTAADAAGLPSIPIGGPIWNTRAYVVDDDLAAVPDGEPGELVVAGAGIARGYLHGEGNDVFINEADLGGPPGRAYRTGDYVEKLPGGILLCLGRRDGQLKVSGHRVEPGELRQAALSVPGVGDAAFLIQETGQLAAFVAPASPAAGAGLAELVRRKLAELLPAAVVPAGVTMVSEIVMNANGKCDPIATARRAADQAGTTPAPSCKASWR